jgi:hypothetical protein
MPAAYMRSPKAAWASPKAPLNRRLRHKSIPCFAGRRSTLSVAIAVIKTISQTKKADRVGTFQRRSTRSAYSSSSPRPMAVAVRLVFRFTSLISLRLSLPNGNGTVQATQECRTRTAPGILDGRRSQFRRCSQRMRGGFTTCTAMFGSVARTGTASIHRTTLLIRKDRIPEKIV